MKVDFFIAGVQKGGTTALHTLLDRHPEIAMSRRKELHFFDDDARQWTDPDYAELERHFRGAEGRLRGEATPIYTYWPRALERLQAYNPAAKLIVLLRHPTVRAFSHWRMEFARGNDDLSFEAAISDTGRARIGQSAGGGHRVYSYIERSLYAAQAVRLKSLFAPEQLLFVRTDHLWLDPRNTLGRIQAFLGVSDIPSPPPRYVVSVDARHVGSIPALARRHLDALFRGDIHATAQATGLDLADWLDPAYRDPLNAVPAIALEPDRDGDRTRGRKKYRSRHSASQICEMSDLPD